MELDHSMWRRTSYSLAIVRFSNANCINVGVSVKHICAAPQGTFSQRFLFINAAKGQMWRWQHARLRSRTFNARATHHASVQACSPEWPSPTWSPFPFICWDNYKNLSGGRVGFFARLSSARLADWEPPVMHKSVFIILAEGTLFHQVHDSTEERR